MWTAGREFEAAQDRAEYRMECRTAAEERAAQAVERWMLGLSVPTLLKILEAQGQADTAEAIREEIAGAAWGMVPSWNQE